LFNVFGRYSIKIGNKNIVYFITGFIKSKKKKEIVRNITTLLFLLKKSFEKRVYKKKGMMIIKEIYSEKKVWSAVVFV